MERFDVRPPNPKLQAKSFSGGNQQKIVLAREIERNPDLLLVGQPTRGVDIGAIEFIHQQIVALRDQGKAILLVSVELDEIMSLSDRIAVMFDGQIMGERLPAETDERELGLLMAGMSERGLRMDIDAKMGRHPSDPADQSGAGAFGLGLVVLYIGENPLEAIEVMVNGALGSTRWLGLYALLRNEFHLHGACRCGRLPRTHVQYRRRRSGHNRRSGRGAGLPFDQLAALALALPVAIIGGALFGAAWAAIPAYLQAERGSHIVITTIMFNFISSALMVYLLVNVMKVPARWRRKAALSRQGRTCPTPFKYLACSAFLSTNSRP